MARNVIKEKDYVFNPSAKTITINRNIREENLMLITNVSDNKVIYNFSDPNLGYSSWERQNEGAAIHTTITLSYNTSLMNADDPLQIIVDDFDQSVTFEDTLLDGVQKLRTANPQSLMDTDFEYSLQPSKWESLFLTSNYPSFFAKGTGANSLDVLSIIGDGTSPRSQITVTTNTPHGLVSGNVVSVQDTISYLVEGTFLVTSTPSATTFIYNAKGVVSGEQVYTGSTSIYGGDIFDGAHIPGGTNTANIANVVGGTNTLVSWTATVDGAAPFSNVTATFANPHGVYPGTQVIVSGTNSFDGNYIINKVPNTRSFTFALNRQQSAITVPSTAQIIVKSDGYVLHRPGDGGVSLTTYNNVSGARTIRQTRRYFRYQSGKAIQFSTGAKFTPTLDVNTMTLNAGSVGQQYVTVQTIQDHGLQPGAQIFVENVKVSGNYNPYNGTFTVLSIVDSNTFRYQVTLTEQVPLNDLAPAGVNVFVHVVNWSGGVTRCGMFDDQNGFFFEYDGTQLSVNRRHSEKEIFGRINVTQNSNVITGTNTRFLKQLLIGTNIVIKGTTYRIIAINSDTSMHVSPSYRGPSINNVRAYFVQTHKIKQQDWNLDKMDGTGPSGFELDIRRMQMVYIDYTWYGAGYIRFGMRANNGNIVYFHRMPNNNVNSAAYQRSGNLPARYEVSNDPVEVSKLVAGESGVRGSELTASGTTMWVEDVEGWPASGVVYVNDSINAEIMRYTSIGAYDPIVKGYPVNGLSRRQSVTITFPDQPFTYSATTNNVTFTPDVSLTGSGGASQVGVQPINQNCAPIITHWGSSVIMDGRYDNDQNYVFTGGMTKYLPVAPGTVRPLLALRLAPSVDNAIARNYGVRELVNRMQMQLSSIGVQTNGSFRIDGYLNPAYLQYTNWTAAQLVASRTGAAGTAGLNTVTITDAKGINGLVIGMSVSGTGIGTNAQITNVSGNTIYLSVANSGTVSGTLTFTPRTGFNGLPADWTRDPIGSGSLAQVLYFDNTGPGAGDVPGAAPSGLILGGDSVFSFYTENGSGTSYNVTSYTLGSIRDLGNSILSGNGNVSSPSYPNGPDLLVIAATNIGTASANISARVSWTEAQA